MARISVKGLSKSYVEGSVKAVQAISFDCNDGEFFCLIGPAGAGKTTTLKLIAGVEAVDAGEIYLDDQPVTDLNPWQRDIALAFETYALYPQLTVRENLAFPLRAPAWRSRWPQSKAEARVVEIADLLGIGELLERYPRELSGGQRQRVALGRALVRKPKAFLLDEPIAHLDAQMRHRMRGELKRIQVEQGITVLYTTPDQLEGLSLAGRMAVMNHGRIEQMGTPDSIYARPANTFVARFVGDPPMNILDARVEGQRLRVGAMRTLDLMAETSRVLTSQAREFKIGIRPRDISIVAEGDPAKAARAEVKHVQRLGETSFVTLETDSVALHVTVATHGAPSRGSNVGLVMDARAIHFFDGKTGLRVEGL